MHSEVVVSAAQAGGRLDRVLCEALPALGRARARRLIEAGLVRRNGRRARAGERVLAGDVLCAQGALASQVPEPDASLPLDVRYEDDALVVVDKPAGMPCHPLRAAERGTLASALLARYPELAGVGHGEREPGLVHRLDTDTSGLLLVARTSEAFARLTRALRAGEIDKRYLALCQGHPQGPAVHHAFLRARGPRVTVRRGPFEGAQPITTEVLLCEPAGPYALVEVRAPFARRHQVRAHLAALGHPLLGDAAYGGPSLEGLARHFLHASALSLRHPLQGEPLSLGSALPAELSAALARARA